MVCRSKGGSKMILSHRQIEEIAVAVTKDFNEFFFGPDTDGARLPRGTPIDQFASEYLGLNVSFADLSADGSICGLTAYADTEYIIEKDGMQYSIPLRRNQVWMRALFSHSRYASSAGKGGLHSPMSAPIKSCSRWRQKKFGRSASGNILHEQPIRSGN